MMEEVYIAKQGALQNPSGWSTYYRIMEKAASFFAKNNVGGDYVFNPKTGIMEKYDYNIHGDLLKKYPELRIEKGIDYGHAITVHKSQGSTVKNVFFDTNTLPKGSTSVLKQGSNIVGSEKMSLIYVGMSRASDNLYLNDENSNLFYDLNSGIIPESNLKTSQQSEIDEFLKEKENTKDTTDWNIEAQFLIDPNGNKTTVQGFMKNLTPEGRAKLRKLILSKDVVFKCK